jgi:hypothetical protein
VRRPGAANSRSQSDPNFGFLDDTFFLGAFGADVVAEAANAGLRDDQFAAGEF